MHWSDSCSGHYIDQVWRIGIARGIRFALTRREIFSGDHVFRPHRSGV
ncbi:DUF3331 domain-containing protein [Paraburkholderia hospita]